MIGAGTPEISDGFDSVSSEGILNAGAALLQPAFFVSEPKVAGLRAIFAGVAVKSGA